MNFYDTLSCTNFKLIGSFKLTDYVRHLLILAEVLELRVFGFFSTKSDSSKCKLALLLSYNTSNPNKPSSSQNENKETLNSFHRMI